MTTTGALLLGVLCGLAIALVAQAIWMWLADRRGKPRRGRKVGGVVWNFDADTSRAVRDIDRARDALRAVHAARGWVQVTDRDHRPRPARGRPQGTQTRGTSE